MDQRYHTKTCPACEMIIGGETLEELAYNFGRHLMERHNIPDHRVSDAVKSLESRYYNLLKQNQDLFGRLEEASALLEKSIEQIKAVRSGNEGEDLLIVMASITQFLDKNK